MSKPVKKAVIPAAGLGTRFLPISKSIPKEMVPIIDKPTIQYVIEEAVYSGLEEILVVTGRNKNSIEDHFDHHFELEHALKEKGKTEQLDMLQQITRMANIYYVRQKEPLGLGHAVMCAREFVGGEPFAVLLGDDIVRSDIPCIKQLLNVYENKNGTVLGLQKISKSDTSKYGIVEIKDWESGDESVFKVNSLVEKPSPEEAPSNLAVMGRYIIDPEIFYTLKQTPPGRGGEIQLTDALNELAGGNMVWGCIFSGIRHDVGDKLGYLKATVEIALEREDLGKEFREYLQRIL